MSFYLTSPNESLILVSHIVHCLIAGNSDPLQSFVNTLLCNNNESVPSQRTRWSPTCDQLAFLQLLFNEKGMRSLNNNQISKVTDYLSKFGKIQEQNVYHWFRNRKADEKRRKMGGFSKKPPTAVSGKSDCH